MHTPEGVTMKSVIKKVDETDYKIQMKAQCFVLKSCLTCQVIPIDDSSCKLVRIQSYPGIIGAVFTSLFHRREANETGEYIKVWSEFAIQKSCAERIQQC